MRVFLDANILFSASVPECATRRLLDAVSARGEILSNAHAIEEARRNLAAKRPSQLPEFEALWRRVRVTDAFVVVSLIGLPAEDVPILAGAVGARCTHLWTSDKRRFGRLCGAIVEGVRIVSSILLADELLEVGRNP